jgi:hypothetical protein
MKHLKTFLILAFIVAANSVSAQSTFDKWPAIKEFHGVLSETFHPAEEGKLAPIKARSAELLAKATKVQKTEIPAEFRTEIITELVNRLQAKSKSLHQLVSNKGADDEIVKSITGLHDIFHEIVGICSDSKK